MIKEKVQLYRHQRGENPPSVQVKINALEGRAKELEIYDVAPFLRSKLFITNGYKVSQADAAIEKVFAADVL